MKELLEALADQHKGQFRESRVQSLGMYHRVARIQWESWDIRVENDCRKGDFDQPDYHEYTFTAWCPCLIDFRAYLYPEGWSDQIWKLFGVQDIQIGEADLDRRFMIKSNSIPQLKRLLLYPPFRERLLSNDKIEFRITKPKPVLSSDRQQLQVELRGSVSPPSPAQFELMLDTFKTGLTQLQKIGIISRKTERSVENR